MPGCTPADIALVIHGTTLATNAVIERKGAKTALLTTEGFRDVLALGNESRYDQYDLNIDLPQPLVPRRWRVTVPERLDNEGHVLRPLDEDGGARARSPSCGAEGVESLAIGFLHSFVNPAHERRAAAIVRRTGPELPVSLSSDVSPEMREWERFSTTVANAYVQPRMARYLHRLEDGLRAAGLGLPAVPDALRRRPDHAGDGRALPDPPGGERPRGRRDLRGPCRAAEGLRRACCPSTWAARRRRSA